MPSFDLLDTYVHGPDGISMTPYWVIAVIPFKHQVTFDRTLENDGNRTFAEVNSDGEAVATNETIIITDCAQLTVQSSKGSHISTLQGLLYPGRNYVEEMNAGDWVFSWMLNSEDDAKDLVQRIRDGKPCNGFKDGLKFMGRVQTIFEDLTVSPDGTRQVMYLLSAVGGTELDSAILYFPQIALNLGGDLPRWWQNFGLYLEQVVHAGDSPDADAGTLNINKVLPNLLKIMLGEGFPQQAHLDLDDDPRLLLTPNQSAYLVPKAVAALLGRKPSKAVPSYADLLEGLIGVQHYSGNDLFPDVEDSGPFYQTGVGLAGEFVPLPPPLDMVPVWNVLGMFLNSAINEMYFTLRLNGVGQVVPFYVARQLPFTTALGKSYQHGLKHTTEFLNLPQWKIPAGLIKAHRLGKTDSTRFNLVQAQGVTSGVGQDAADIWVLNPPVRDDTDLKRSGLRPFQRTVNCSYKDSRQGAKSWTNTLADFMMGMQLTRNGTLTLYGVHAPVPVGDNIELGGRSVYHIETISHTCTLSPDGQRSFETVLSLSHGMSSVREVRTRTDHSEPPHEAQYIARETSLTFVSKQEP